MYRYRKESAIGRSCKALSVFSHTVSACSDRGFAQGLEISFDYLRFFRGGAEGAENAEIFIILRTFAPSQLREKTENLR